MLDGLCAVEGWNVLPKPRVLKAAQRLLGNVLPAVARFHFDNLAFGAVEYDFDFAFARWHIVDVAMALAGFSRAALDDHVSGFVVEWFAVDVVGRIGRIAGPGIRPFLGRVERGLGNIALGLCLAAATSSKRNCCGKDYDMARAHISFTTTNGIALQALDGCDACQAGPTAGWTCQSRSPSLHTHCTKPVAVGERFAASSLARTMSAST